MANLNTNKTQVTAATSTTVNNSKAMMREINSPDSLEQSLNYVSC